jgi:hypothetical protein
MMQSGWRPRTSSALIALLLLLGTAAASDPVDTAHVRRDQEHRRLDFFGDLWDFLFGSGGDDSGGAATDDVLTDDAAGDDDLFTYNRTGDDFFTSDDTVNRTGDDFFNDDAVNRTGDDFFEGVVFPNATDDFFGLGGDDGVHFWNFYDDYGSFNGIMGASLNTVLTQLGLSNRLNQSLVENTTCTTTGPDCAYNDYGSVGTWVCRSLFNPLDGSLVQWNACVNAEDVALVTDSCGCCGGACPAACACACEVETHTGYLAGNSTAGVWVQSNRSGFFFDVINWLLPDSLDFNLTEDGKSTVCVPVAVAASLVALPGDETTCLATCPAA